MKVALISTILILSSCLNAGETKLVSDKKETTPTPTPINSVKSEKKTEEPVATEDEPVKTVEFVVEKSYGFLWIIKYSNLRVYVNKSDKSKPIAEQSLWYFWSSYQDKFASKDLEISATVTVAKESSEEEVKPVEHPAKVLTFEDTQDIKTLKVDNFANEFSSCLNAAGMTAQFGEGKWEKKIYEVKLDVICKENKMKGIMNKGLKDAVDEQVVKQQEKNSKLPDKQMIKDDSEPQHHSSNPQDQGVVDKKQESMEEIQDPSFKKSQTEPVLLKTSTVEDKEVVQNADKKEITQSGVMDVLQNHIHDKFHDEELHNGKQTVENQAELQDSKAEVEKSFEFQDPTANQLNDSKVKTSDLKMIL